MRIVAFFLQWDFVKNNVEIYFDIISKLKTPSDNPNKPTHSKTLQWLAINLWMRRKILIRICDSEDGLDPGRGMPLKGRDG